MAGRGNGQRVFILVIVAVFFLSSVAITGVIILDQIRQNNDAKEFQAQLEAQQQVQEQLNQPEEQNEENQEDKLEGTKLANFTPVAKVEKLETIDIKEGSGEVVPKGATVTAHYTGALAKDGTIFQSSYDMGNPIPFSLNEVIKGWTDGVPGMKVGGERRIIIPADQAYGASERPGIPANSDLVFDIVLVKLGE